jgi:hypothetical protein
MPACTYSARECGITRGDSGRRGPISRFVTARWMREHAAPAKEKNPQMHPSECASKEMRSNRARNPREDRLMTRRELAKRAGGTP